MNNARSSDREPRSRSEAAAAAPSQNGNGRAHASGSAARNGFSYRRSAALFARNFFKHPKMLGSLIPSSRFLIERVLSQVDWQKAKVIVEYGPGVGTITGEVLKRLPKDGALVVFETNCEFVRFLRESFCDPRLHVIHGSAADVDAFLKAFRVAGADYVISGIPFSTMPGEVRDSILETTHAVLQPEGAFLVYQFSGAVLPYLQRVFGYVDRDFELFNIMPARLFYCRRNGEPVRRRDLSMQPATDKRICPACNAAVS